MAVPSRSGQGPFCGAKSCPRTRGAEKSGGIVAESSFWPKTNRADLPCFGPNIWAKYTAERCPPTCRARRARRPQIQRAAPRDIPQDRSHSAHPFVSPPPDPAERTFVSSDSPSYRKWLLGALKLAIVVLVLAGIGHEIIKARHSFAEHKFSLWDVDYRWLPVAGLAYLVGMLPMAVFWFAVMRALGQRPLLGATLRAFYIGHLGKYVPGKAMVVFLRTGLVRGLHVDTTVAAVSVFVETLTMMAAGAFLAAVILAVKSADQLPLLLLAIGLMLCAGVPTMPPVFRRLVYWLKVRKLNPEIGQHLRGLTWRLMACGWAGNLCGYALFGVSMWAVLRAMPGVDARAIEFLPSLPLITASVCLAMVAGFLSLLPGGVLVREFVILALLKHQIGRVAALVAAVLLRLVWMAAEVILAGLLYWTVRAPRAREEHPGHAEVVAQTPGRRSQPEGTRP